MTEILKKINDSGLSPNQYFLLYALNNNLEIKNFNLDQEKEILKERGQLDGDMFIGAVSQEISEAAFHMKAVQYIRIFPPMILPTGIHARGKISQVKNKLKTFISTYEYDWDVIYQAAEKYVNRYKAQKYMYMQNASNFILDKNGDSTLALECDTLEYNESDNSDVI